MQIVTVIMILVVIGLLVAAFIGQLPWKQALIYMAAVGLVALGLFLLLPLIA